VLTQAGRDFRPVLWALLAWGNRHFAPEGASVVVVDSQTGEQAEPVLMDRKSGRPLVEPTFRSAAGPAADARGGPAMPLPPSSKQKPGPQCWIPTVNCDWANRV